MYGPGILVATLSHLSTVPVCELRSYTRRIRVVDTWVQWYEQLTNSSKVNSFQGYFRIWESLITSAKVIHPCRDITTSAVVKLGHSFTRYIRAARIWCYHDFRPCYVLSQQITLGQENNGVKIVKCQHALYSSLKGSQIFHIHVSRLTIKFTFIGLFLSLCCCLCSTTRWRWNDFLGSVEHFRVQFAHTAPKNKSAGKKILSDIYRHKKYYRRGNRKTFYTTNFIIVDRVPVLQ